MIKFVGAVFILLSASYIGFYKANTLRKRMVYLNNIRTSLHMLESEIFFSQNILFRVFKRISNLSDTCGLFSNAAEGINEFGIKRAWERAVDETYEKMCLKNQDREVLYIFGANLGMSDKESQIKNIKHVVDMINSLYDGAAEDYKKNAGLYRSAGFLAGLFFAILLY